MTTLRPLVDAVVLVPCILGGLRVERCNQQPTDFAPREVVPIRSGREFTHLPRKTPSRHKMGSDGSFPQRDTMLCMILIGVVGGLEQIE